MTPSAPSEAAADHRPAHSFAKPDINIRDMTPSARPFVVSGLVQPIPSLILSNDCPSLLCQQAVVVDHPPTPKNISVEVRRYGHKRVFIFDDHATAIKPWAQLRAEAGHPLFLLTLDHHTDTHPAFYRQAYGAHTMAFPFDALRRHWIAELDFADPASVEVAVQRLRHDEHISAALNVKIFAAALVVAIDGTSPTYSLEYEYARRTGQPLPPRPHRYHIPDPKIFRLGTQSELMEFPERVIGSRFLAKTLAEADNIMSVLGRGKLFDEDYILDIDLDYFTSPAALQPTQKRVFHRLLTDARAITIAREPGFVRDLSYGTLTVDSCFQLLESHLIGALGDRL